MARGNKFLKFLSVLLCILLIGGCAVVGMINAKSYGYSFKDEKAGTICIESSDDLKGIGKSFYNNSYYLANDITITSLESLTTSDRPFIGQFDGRGHTITFKGDTTQALIGYIGEEGKVFNLNIVVSKCKIQTDYIGLLAYENRGTIENCKISGSLTIASSGLSSVLVAINKGTIKNVVMQGLTVSRPQIQETDKTVYGGLCVYNYSQIENIIAYKTTFVNISETVRYNIFHSSVKNYGVGNVYGVNMGGTASGLIELDSSQYLSDESDKNLVPSVDVALVLNMDYVTDTLGFDIVSVWELKNNNLKLRGTV